MKTIGFPISQMEGEKRRAILPGDLASVRNRAAVAVEEGYGAVLGISDREYSEAGARVLKRKEILECGIICDPKAGEGDYLRDLDGRTIFGWVHAVQNQDVTEALLASRARVYAWEDMYEANGTHTFARNNFIAGEAGIYHSFMVMGMLPTGRRVAVLGRGNVAKGAVSMLEKFGAEVVQYGRADEDRFREEAGGFDAIVNAIKWDTSRTDHIIYRKDLGRLRKGCFLVDISCDRAGAIETSVPTVLSNPVYVVDGVAHYVVSNIPSLLYQDASAFLGSVVARFVDTLAEGGQDPVLEGALILSDGRIIDPKILEYRKLHNL